MCNLYSITKNQDAIRQLFRVTADSAGNLGSMPGVFPDYEAPVIRNQGEGRELIKMRGGMPPPPQFGGPPITNIRNLSSPHWRGWLKPENRCLVPFNSFAEYAPRAQPRHQKERRGLVCPERETSARCLRRLLDRVQGRPWNQVQARSGPTQCLRLSHH
jgi:putative SOS response-associated peptidase YedK